MKTLQWLTLTLSIPAWGVSWSQAADTRPNIVLIMCDDMGYSDVGCYGGGTGDRSRWD